MGGSSKAWILLIALVVTSDLAGVAQARTLGSAHGKQTTHRVKVTSPPGTSQPDFEEDDGSVRDKIKAKFDRLGGGDLTKEEREERKKFRAGHLASRIKYGNSNIQFWNHKDASGKSAFYALPSYSVGVAILAFVNVLVSAKTLRQYKTPSATSKTYSIVACLVTWGLIVLVSYSLVQIVHRVSHGDPSFTGSMMSFIFQFMALTVLGITALVMETPWMHEILGGDMPLYRYLDNTIFAPSEDDKNREYGPYLTSLIIMGTIVICFMKTNISKDADDDFIKVWMMAMMNVLLMISFGWFYFFERHTITRGIQIDNNTGEENQNKWGTALYFSVITQSTVGYGDVGIDQTRTQLMVLVHAIMIYLFAIAQSMSFIQAESNTGVDVTATIESTDDEETKKNKLAKNANMHKRDIHFFLGTVGNILGLLVILFYKKSRNVAKSVVSVQDSTKEIAKAVIAFLLIVGNTYGITNVIRRRRNPAMRGRRDLLKIAINMAFLFSGIFAFSAYEFKKLSAIVGRGVQSTAVVGLVFVYFAQTISAEYYAHTASAGQNDTDADADEASVGQNDTNADEEFLGFVLFACLHLAIIYTFAWTYFLNRGDYDIDQFFDALFFSVITHTTVGYGQVSVKTMFAKVICMVHATVASVLALGGLAAVHSNNVSSEPQSPADEAATLRDQALDGQRSSAPSADLSAKADP